MRNPATILLAFAAVPALGAVAGRGGKGNEPEDQSLNPSNLAAILKSHLPAKCEDLPCLAGAGGDATCKSAGCGDGGCLHHPAEKWSLNWGGCAKKGDETLATNLAEQADEDARVWLQPQENGGAGFDKPLEQCAKIKCTGVGPSEDCAREGCGNVCYRDPKLEGLHKGICGVAVKNGALDKAKVHKRTSHGQQQPRDQSPNEYDKDDIVRALKSYLPAKCEDVPCPLDSHSSSNACYDAGCGGRACVPHPAESKLGSGRCAQENDNDDKAAQEDLVKMTESDASKWANDVDLEPLEQCAAQACTKLGASSDCDSVMCGKVCYVDPDAKNPNHGRCAVLPGKNGSGTSKLASTSGTAKARLGGRDQTPNYDRILAILKKNLPQKCEDVPCRLKNKNPPENFDLGCKNAGCNPQGCIWHPKETVANPAWGRCAAGSMGPEATGLVPYAEEDARKWADDKDIEPLEQCADVKCSLVGVSYECNLAMCGKVCYKAEDTHHGRCVPEMDEGSTWGNVKSWLGLS
ncbi:Uu.00g021890.m01.CDS01 [Anthostomella pinea]|uniref:Uu.00g021890.m01.CDS01 n=1 Tax=Anthostomella pinea TaxID=933095 RepID=A0AAI8W0N7_9PEZI|nr:Uu.00g021890.m01.CDS01 [Anthostomella pinea]